MLKGKQPIKEYDISCEKYRVYTVLSTGGAVISSILVRNPLSLYCAPGHFFHRVYDGEEVKLCPAPGVVRDHEGDIIGYCVVSWKPKDANHPCKF